MQPVAVYTKPQHLLPTPKGTRGAVLLAIFYQPGIHKSRLCRHLQLGWGTVNHHVSRLIAEGHLRAIRQGRESLLFPAIFSPQEIERLSMLRQEQERVTRLAFKSSDMGMQVDVRTAALNVHDVERLENTCWFAHVGFLWLSAAWPIG